MKGCEICCKSEILHHAFTFFYYNVHVLRNVIEFGSKLSSILNPKLDND